MFVQKIVPCILCVSVKIITKQRNHKHHDKYNNDDFFNRQLRQFFTYFRLFFHSLIQFSVVNHNLFSSRFIKRDLGLTYIGFIGRKCIVLVPRITNNHSILRVLSSIAVLFPDAGINFISIFTFVQFLSQNLFLFSLFLDLSCFLGIFVKFYDSDYSEKFDNTHSSCSCSRGL